MPQLAEAEPRNGIGQKLRTVSLDDESENCTGDLLCFG